MHCVQWLQFARSSLQKKPLELTIQGAPCTKPRHEWRARRARCKGRVHSGARAGICPLLYLAAIRASTGVDIRENANPYTALPRVGKRQQIFCALTRKRRSLKRNHTEVDAREKGSITFHKLNGCFKSKRYRRSRLNIRHCDNVSKRTTPVTETRVRLGGVCRTYALIVRAAIDCFTYFCPLRLGKKHHAHSTVMIFVTQRSERVALARARARPRPPAGARTYDCHKNSRGSSSPGFPSAGSGEISKKLVHSEKKKAPRAVYGPQFLPLVTDGRRRRHRLRPRVTRRRV
ncbi:hypothetical protein EVAR_58163_1 [Eumeta japonica]|uniref:Uncharacterized protein n=1 Tax=Eumeta variegata TaxID=151549 RepID=A0A4C1X301_EUMVA|nr:hypothetical protein EVAR_58163_1 [Eumeta japonica]